MYITYFKSWLSNLTLIQICRIRIILNTDVYIIKYSDINFLIMLIKLKEYYQLNKALINTEYNIVVGR